MKGCFDEMTSKVSLRSQSACTVSRSPDYLVTTMKLRERVQSARCSDQHKVYRKTIRSLRSAPPFQNRNLDNYPMPYNREDAVRSAKGHRTQKRDSASRMVQARTDSGLLRDYSKQMFDFTVKNVNNFNLIRNVKDNNVHLDRRSKSVNENVSFKTNGPTPDGSMLHNRRQRVLNSIRVRPHPDFESRFHHDRSHSSLSLQNTISDKNRHYRVRSRPGSVLGDASMAGSDFVFIPVDQSSECNGLLNGAETNFRRETIDTVISGYMDEDSLDAVFGKDPFDDVDEGSSSICGHTKPISQSCRLSHSTLLPPDISCNLRLVSLEEESSSESEVEKEEPPPEVKKPDPPPVKKPDPPPPVKPTGRKKPPEPEPEPEPVKVKLILKGPHCWVDDATVTSDEEADGNPEGTTCNLEIEQQQQQQQQQQDSTAEKLNNAQKADSKPRSALKNATAVNVKQMGSTAVNQMNIQAMKDAFEKAVQNVQSKPGDITENKDKTNSQNPTEVVKEDSVEETESEPEIVLPPFLCPSSEKKSREAALKDWLAHTCFQSGYRGLPIV